MTQYRIDSDRSEVFVEARSNVHPIEIRTQGVKGTIEVEVRNGLIDLSSAPRADLEIAADLLRSGIDLYDSEIHRRIEVRKYRTIKKPAILLWGREDQVTQLRFGERLSKELPDAKLVVYPQCGHFPIIKAESASTADLATFLEPELKSQTQVQVQQPVVAPQQNTTTGGGGGIDRDGP